MLGFLFLIFGAVIDSTLIDEIRVTVIATGFNMPNSLETDKSVNPENNENSNVPTRILQEQMNQPLYSQKEDDSDQRSKMEKPTIKFDDTEETPTVIYGKDLQVPAFIRRQQD